MINSKSSQQISYCPMRLLLFKLYSIRHAMEHSLIIDLRYCDIYLVLYSIVYELYVHCNRNVPMCNVQSWLNMRIMFNSMLSLEHVYKHVSMTLPMQLIHRLVVDYILYIIYYLSALVCHFSWHYRPVCSLYSQYWCVSRVSRMEWQAYCYALSLTFSLFCVVVNMYDSPSCLLYMHSITMHAFINVWCSRRFLPRVSLSLCVALRWFQWLLTKRRAHTHYYASDDDPSDIIVVHINPSAYTTTWSSEPRDAQICELLSFAHTPVTTSTSFTLSANFLHADFVLLFSISILCTNTSHTLRAPTH